MIDADNGKSEVLGWRTATADDTGTWPVRSVCSSDTTVPDSGNAPNCHIRECQCATVDVRIQVFLPTGNCKGGLHRAERRSATVPSGHRVCEDPTAYLYLADGKNEKSTSFSVTRESAHELGAGDASPDSCSRAQHRDRFQRNIFTTESTKKRCRSSSTKNRRRSVHRDRPGPHDRS